MYLFSILEIVSLRGNLESLSSAFLSQSRLSQWCFIRENYLDKEEAENFSARERKNVKETFPTNVPSRLSLQSCTDFEAAGYKAARILSCRISARAKRRAASRTTYRAQASLAEINNTGDRVDDGRSPSRDSSSASHSRSSQMSDIHEHNLLIESTP